jgi:hypothetical protein
VIAFRQNQLAPVTSNQRLNLEESGSSIGTEVSSEGMEFLRKLLSFNDFVKRRSAGSVRLCPMRKMAEVISVSAHKHYFDLFLSEPGNRDESTVRDRFELCGLKPFPQAASATHSRE